MNRRPATKFIFMQNTRGPCTAVELKIEFTASEDLTATRTRISREAIQKSI